MDHHDRDDRSHLGSLSRNRQYCARADALTIAFQYRQQTYLDVEMRQLRLKFTYGRRISCKSQLTSILSSMSAVRAVPIPGRIFQFGDSFEISGRRMEMARNVLPFAITRPTLRSSSLLREPNGRRDREVQGVGVERNELCQQPDDPLGILRPAHRHTVVLPSERYFGEAARAVVAHHRENVAVLRRIERAAHLERVLHVQGQDAAEELVDAERRARNDLIDDRAERRPFETEYQRVGVGIRVLHPLQVLAAWAVPGNGTRQQVIEDFGTVVPVRAPGQDRIEAEAPLSPPPAST